VAVVKSAKIFEKDRATQEFVDTGIVIFEDGHVEGENEELKTAYQELLWINLKRNNTWPQIVRNFTDGYKRAVEVREPPKGPSPAAPPAKPQP
jgi:hypothetical protein